MKYTVYEPQFRHLAQQAGFSEHNIQKCLDYAKPLIEKNLPVVFNTSNLSALVGYNKSYLKRAALYTNYFYRKFLVKKKNGGKREIKEPLPSLKEIQIWILENLLSKIPVSRFAKAYIKGRNILENVKYHKAKDVILTLDIENFFPSIKFDKVELIFLKLGYSANVSNLFARLCCNELHLPQGAPTSPTISNIYLREFDEAIFSFCKEKTIRFTRYADDLTFSFSKEQDSSEIISYVSEQLKGLGLKINSKKTKVLTPNMRQVVTGIIVNEKLQIPKYKRKEIRQEMFFIKKLGLAKHLENTKNTRANYIKHLAGKINFALHINPDDVKMQEYRSFIQAFLNPS